MAVEIKRFNEINDNKCIFRHIFLFSRSIVSATFHHSNDSSLPKMLIISRHAKLSTSIKLVID